jgi:hypothetical protein
MDGVLYPANGAPDLSGYINTDQKGVPDGVASLDSSGQVAQPIRKRAVVLEWRPTGTSTGDGMGGPSMLSGNSMTLEPSTRGSRAKFEINNTTGSRDIQTRAFTHFGLHPDVTFTFELSTSKKNQEIFVGMGSSNGNINAWYNWSGNYDQGFYGLRQPPSLTGTSTVEFIAYSKTSGLTGQAGSTPRSRQDTGVVLGLDVVYQFRIHRLDENPPVMELKNLDTDTVLYTWTVPAASAPHLEYKAPVGTAAAIQQFYMLALGHGCTPNSSSPDNVRMFVHKVRCEQDGA